MRIVLLSHCLYTSPMDIFFISNAFRDATLIRGEIFKRVVLFLAWIPKDLTVIRGNSIRHSFKGNAEFSSYMFKYRVTV